MTDDYGWKIWRHAETIIICDNISKYYIIEVRDRREHKYGSYLYIQSKISETTIYLKCSKTTCRGTGNMNIHPSNYRELSIAPVELHALSSSGDHDTKLFEAGEEDNAEAKC
uniref:Uncharacterized protein n=1 Tax=Strigamia maritima TaxID=126957 RepID=T1J8Z8_STRMM